MCVQRVRVRCHAIGLSKNKIRSPVRDTRRSKNKNSEMSHFVRSNFDRGDKLNPAPAVPDALAFQNVAPAPDFILKIDQFYRPNRTVHYFQTISGRILII